MVFNKYILKVSLRLAAILLVMLALSLLIGQEARLFSILGLCLLLLLQLIELFRTIARTNFIVKELIESIHHGDFNKTIYEKASDLGFASLADSAQQIIAAIAAAKIEKETQYQYLRSILEHINTPVLTMDEKGEPELINPLALLTLGLYNLRQPTRSQIQLRAPRFIEAIEALGESGRRVIHLDTMRAGKQLLILVNTIKLTESKVRIITFQDIEQEMDEKAMESWQNISRIMAHEIMNSLTPLSSLTETGIMMLEENGKPVSVDSLPQQTIDNLHQALLTISDRNQALVKFIGNYRQLSRLPLPEKKEVTIALLLEEVHKLHRDHCADREVCITLYPGPAGLTAFLDEDQVKQVLINLVKNALEAIDGLTGARVELFARRVEDDVLLEVRDTGRGIPADLIDKIFIPFFSTKTGGSGIGLSLSRQIIHNHGGRLSVQSDPSSGTAFLAYLPLV